MKKILISVCITIFLLNFLACSKNNSDTNNEEENFLQNLIVSNYKQAEVVAVLKLTDLDIKEEIKTKEGNIGYIITKETGHVLDVFKGDIKSDSELTYNDWLEYSKDWKENRPKQAIVFLKYDSKIKGYRTIAEAAVFAYDKEVQKIISDCHSKR